MWKPIRKHYKVALVWGVVCLLTFDTATACRFLARRRACRSQCVVTVCEPTCGPPMYNDGCGSGRVKLDKGGQSAPTVDETPPEAPRVDEPTSPGDAATPLERDVQKPMEPAPAEPMQDMPPAEIAPKLNTMPPQPAEPAPVETTPAQPAPAEQAPKAQVDDLFGDTPKPAETPAKPAAPKTDVDDLFGDTPKPAEQPAAPPAKPAPAKEPADDLFGDTPKPANTPAPAPATPKSDVDDLFGEPAAAPAKPGNQPAPAPAPKKDAVDDLFGGETKPAEPATPPAKEPAKAVEDPFGAKVDPKQELLVMRQWIDNTGAFRVHGQLIEVLDGKVRLLKDNGRTCTVSMRRLSAADAQYVQMVVSKLGKGTLVQLASR